MVEDRSKWWAYPTLWIVLQNEKGRKRQKSR